MSESKYKKALERFDELLSIMDDLREKCPWDRAQTLLTLRNLTIEEAYELNQALLEEDYSEIKKELGDLLLHIVFYSKITSQEDKFDIADVIDSLNKKLIRRHPHIYSDTKAEDSNAVKENWEKIKQKEGQKSVLSGVPASLPALIKAFRIQDKAKGVGFQWDNKEDVWEKVEEEKEEFFKEVNSENPDKEKITQEFGDLLFALVNYARYNDIDPELALEKTNLKFIRRFKYIETTLKEQNKNIHEVGLEEMDEIWNIAKKNELEN